MRQRGLWASSSLILGESSALYAASNLNGLPRDSFVADAIWGSLGHETGCALGVALAGDAAHAMHPLAGQGLNVGLGDVAELARVMHQRESWRVPGDLRLLRRYERARQADVAAMSTVTDGLYGLFAHDNTQLQALRHWGLKRFDRSGAIKQWVVRQAAGSVPLHAGH